jgi:DNA end-binding protein Ku
MIFPRRRSEMVALAIELIQRRTKPFEPGVFHDAYALALEQLVERKRKGHAVVTTRTEERRPSGKVINLIDALKKSLGEDPKRGLAGKGDAKTRGRGAGKARAAKTSVAKKRA